MFRLNKQEFTRLLSFHGSLDSILNVYNFTTFICLNYHPWMTRPTLIDLNFWIQSRIALLFIFG